LIQDKSYTNEDIFEYMNSLVNVTKRKLIDKIIVKLMNEDHYELVKIVDEVLKRYLRIHELNNRLRATITQKFIDGGSEMDKIRYNIEVRVLNKFIEENPDDIKEMLEEIIQ